MPEEFDINEQDRLSLIKELEAIKQKLNHYETEIKPLAERELNRIREEQVKAFRLDEAQRTVMTERLAGINSEEAIISTAKEIAVALRVENKPTGADPTGNNQRVRMPKVKGSYEVGRDNAKRLISEGKFEGSYRGNEGVGGVRSSFTGAPASRQTQFKTNRLTGVINKFFG
ncbi:hypothetical protein CN383_00115 [Priestia megaterium]|uniref:hypothetical protein n=1 Tax=Priestia megaterium TaxID=1404 RepID=UPI000BF7F8DA|nr:hypothetical protein [Priestia megaterium]PFB07258.1 hypothetical protein CN383_00115 [Priestia megaterium]